MFPRREKWCFMLGCQLDERMLPWWPSAKYHGTMLIIFVRFYLRFPLFAFNVRYLYNVPMYLLKIKTWNLTQNKHFIWSNHKWRDISEHHLFWMWSIRSVLSGVKDVWVRAGGRKPKNRGVLELAALLGNRILILAKPGTRPALHTALVPG